MPTDDEFRQLQQQLQNLANQLNAARNRIQDLEDFATDHIGLDWGATISGIPHPTMLMMHREIHGPSKSSVDATHSATFPVEFDDSISHLHQSKLIVRLSAVRSNVSTAASGGSSSPTTSSGGSQTPTSSSGGAQTSSSGGSSTPTTSSGGGQTPTTGMTGTTYVIQSYPNGFETGTPSTASTQAQSDSHTHNETGSVTGYENNNHTHSLNDHTHTLPEGTTIGVAASTHTHSVTVNAHDHTVTIGDHTHTVSDHTHTVTIDAHTHDVTIPGHTHDLTYGIYEGSAPSTPQITVAINGTDRTSALGGPWDDDFTVDVTAYLRDANNGFPLRQVNTIVLASDELLDVEITVKSFASAVPPASIGVQS